MSDKQPPIDFARLVDAHDVAPWVGIEREELAAIAEDPSSFYEKYELPKRNGQGTRVVFKVEGTLKAAQRLIARSIALCWTPDDCVYGYVKGKSIAANAARHLNKAIVLHIDLQDFFGFITDVHVIDAFQILGAAQEAAEMLAKICTLDGSLPQGASSSPALSNVVVRNLDKDLLDIAKRRGATYTRYADDLVFSGQDVPPMRAIAAVVHAHGLAVNESKTRKQLRGRPQYVTGLTVADSTAPRVPRLLKRQLRQDIYFVKKYGLQDHANRRGENPSYEGKRLLGLVSYVQSIEKSLGERLRAELRAALLQVEEPHQGMMLSET
jgi:RNA-directed DNA polymerase